MFLSGLQGLDGEPKTNSSLAKPAFTKNQNAAESDPLYGVPV
jgi:hypothetical protein